MLLFNIQLTKNNFGFILALEKYILADNVCALHLEFKNYNI